MKVWCFIVFTFLLSACNETSSNNNISSPQEETLQLNNHTVNDILKLDDESLWLIVGLSSSDGVLSSENNDVIIYDNPDDFGVPDLGVRGEYYVFINNTADSFYIDPITPPKTLQSGVVELSSLLLDSVAVLEDNSVWSVVGVDDSETTIDSDFTYTLYEVDEDFPDLTDGSSKTSRWYLYNEAAPFGYYLTPLVEASVVQEDLHTFYSEWVNDSILLSDGSLWLITGSIEPEIGLVGEYSIKIIKNLNNLGAPYQGEEADNVLYIPALRNTYYVKEI